MNVQRSHCFMPNAETCLYAEQVWSATAEAAFADSESGAIARMHSALIAVLTHVVTRLGPAALSNPQACYCPAKAFFTAGMPVSTCMSSHQQQRQHSVISSARLLILAISKATQKKHQRASVMQQLNGIRH